MRTEEPTWDGPFFGEFGVLVDDGDKVQCHVCGGMYAHLGQHTNLTHGLTADEYRKAFGLMQSTKLIGPTFRAKRSQIAADHLRQVDNPHRDRVRNLTPEQREAVLAKVVRRKEHDLNRTPPERTRAAIEARYGDPRGRPDEFLIEVVNMFLEELHNGQRGVYRRMGRRMGVDADVARSRVWQAVKRGHLVWTGADHEPAGHRPGEEPWDPPGSFEHRFYMLEEWVAEHGHAKVPRQIMVGDVKLGVWVVSVRDRFRRGTLTEERARRLEALPGWSWGERLGH